MDSSKSFQRKWRKLRSLSFREWRWFIAAWLAMPLIRVNLSLRGFQKTRSRWNPPRRPAASLNPDEIQQLAARVRSAAVNHLLELNCVPQSIWLSNRLARYGVDHELRLGVTGVDDAGLRAHAWVEVGGVRLNEPSGPEAGSEPFAACRDAAELPS